MVRLISLFLILFLPSAAMANPAKEAFERGIQLFEAEEYQAALPEFQKAYELSGRRASAVFALAQCERALEMFPEAIAHFQEYLQSDPENAAEIHKTLDLLEIQKAKAEAEQAKAEAEAERRRLAEEKLRAELALAKKEAKLEADRRRRAEEAAANPTVIVQSPPPPVAEAPAEEESTIVESPAFWIVTGIVVVGGAVAAGVLATQLDKPYGGSTGVTLSP